MITGAILRIVVRNDWSWQMTNGFCGALFTFNILNRIHRITANTANNAVDMLFFCFVTPQKLYFLLSYRYRRMKRNAWTDCSTLSNICWRVMKERLLLRWRCSTTWYSHQGLYPTISRLFYRHFLTVDLRVPINS